MVRSAAVVVAALIIPSFAQAQEPAGTHTVVRGNTLWDLAATYYQDPFQWRVIWQANTEVVEDPNWIYPTEVLVIPGLPADPTADPPTGDPATGDPEGTEDPVAPTGDPTTPDVEEVDPNLIPFGFRAARPSNEARSIFYSDPSEASNGIVTMESVATAAVSRDAVVSAPWLIGLEGDPDSDGVIVGFADGSNRVSTIRSYTNVRVDMATEARVGARLQIFRVSRTIDMVGQVVQPTGVLEVTTIGDGFVVGQVIQEFDRIQPGDFVRPVPAYTPVLGAVAEEISGGSEAMIMGFSGRRVLSGIGQIAFLDLGSSDGIAIGDEFVLYGTAVPTAREGSLQVIGLSPNTSAARVLSMSDDVFRQGVVVRLAKKMR